jgi:hypothetical protein
MPLETNKALSFARSLTTVPDFPRIDEAILQTREDLQGLVKHLPDELAQARIEWLVRKIRHCWDSWPEHGGTSGMIALYHREFDAPQHPNGFRQYEKPAAVECEFCQDTGIVRVGNDPETAAWCICTQAKTLQETWPEYLELVRAGNPIRPHVVRSETIRPEVEQAVRSAIPNFERCPQCNGTGIADGQYCDCELGKDLRRVEEKGSSA